MRLLAVRASARMAHFLSGRINMIMAGHTRLCRTPRKCKHDKHRRYLNNYIHLFGEAAVLEDEVAEVLGAIGCW